MKAYCIFDNIEVNDFLKLEEYKKKVEPVITQFGGQYLVLGGQFTVIEGTWRPKFLIMIEFPSIEKASHWYFSEEYRELKSLRLSAARSNGIILEGL
jgi:uncharacterized protein (DUF1330 family)